MRAIAIDYGDKRCGIAIEMENIAIPKDIVLRINIIEILKEYFKKYEDIGVIIVGLPYDLYGKDLKQLNKTKEFIRELNNKFKDKYKIIGIDERFSSFEADNILKKIGNKNNIGKKDAISASIILETYLNNKQNYV